MFEITVTDDFVRMITELPVKYKPILDNSFLSIKKSDSDEIENKFFEELERVKEEISYALS